MLRLVLRELRHDPLRTLLTSVSLAGVVAVILIFEGFLQGIVDQSRDVVLERGSDLIVTQAGIENLTLARSTLPQVSRTQVESVRGVIAAHPLTGLPVIYEQGGVRAPLHLFVYDSSGGPTHIVAGRPANEPREIVVDQSFAAKFGLSVGDPLVISDFEFVIAGITRGSAAFFSAFGFLRYDDLIDFYFQSDLAADIGSFPLLSFLLVDVVPGTDPAAVAADIERSVPSADVFLPRQLADRDASLARTLFGPIIALLIGAGYVSGALVSGIMMFTAVNNRRRSLGVLKALGFSHGYLTAAVVVEALVLIAMALPLGLVLAEAIGRSIEILMPLYLIPIAKPLPLLRTATAGIVFATLGALTPVRQVRRLDPSTVFGS